jgi:hypothetical protein
MGGYKAVSKSKETPKQKLTCLEDAYDKLYNDCTKLAAEIEKTRAELMKDIPTFSELAVLLGVTLKNENVISFDKVINGDYADRGVFLGDGSIVTPELVYCDNRWILIFRKQKINHRRH